MQLSKLAKMLILLSFIFESGCFWLSKYIAAFLQHQSMNFFFFLLELNHKLRSLLLVLPILLHEGQRGGSLALFE